MILHQAKVKIQSLSFRNHFKVSLRLTRLWYTIFLLLVESDLGEQLFPLQDRSVISDDFSVHGDQGMSVIKFI